MAELDEVDLEILELLVADARRPWNEIAAQVDLSAPAVADRVNRLQEAGVIERFTVDLDRSQLRGGVPVLVELQLDSGATGPVRESLRGADAIEHVFESAEGTVIFMGRIPDGDVTAWLADELAETMDDVREYDVTLVTATEWTPGLGGTAFALTCAECGNTVTSEGETVVLDGERYDFCCQSCETRFVERYERMAEEAD